MAESFTLDIEYKGKHQEVTCSFKERAFTYQFLCTIGNSEMILERDDEGKFRALEADPFSKGTPKPDPGMVKVLIEEMERILQ